MQQRKDMETLGAIKKPTNNTKGLKRQTGQNIQYIFPTLINVMHIKNH